MPAPAAPITQDVATIPRKAPDGKPNLVGLTRDAMRDAFAAIGLPERQLKMRVNQVWQWIYHWGVRDFAAMTNLVQGRTARAWRTPSSSNLPRGRVSPSLRRRHAQVPRPHRGRARGRDGLYSPKPTAARSASPARSAARSPVPSATPARRRLVRNLTAAEIVGQILLARDDLGEWPEPGQGTGENGPRLLSNVVLMGMGEPLYNFENVRDAMKIAMDGEGIALSRRRITLSTSGVVPEIARTATRRSAACWPSASTRPRTLCATCSSRSTRSWNIETLARFAEVSIRKRFELGTDHLRVRHARRGERRRSRTRIGWSNFWTVSRQR